MIVNKDVPLLTTKSHDYLWLLELTKDRKCKEIKPCVIRYEHGNNLSHNIEYRLEDWDMVINIMKEDNNIAGIKRLNATRAKYYYKFGDYRQARKYLFISKWSIKNIAYFFTSYFPLLAKWVVKQYNVFG
jgi:hypothetical protein